MNRSLSSSLCEWIYRIFMNIKKNRSWKLVMGVVIGVLLFITLSCNGMSVANKDEENVNVDETFDEYFRNLTNNFPSQPHDNWEILKYYVRRFVKTKPHKPVIIVLLHDGFSDTAHCITRHIANAVSFRISNNENVAYLDVSALVRLKDDSDIITTFKKELNEKSVLVLNDLEKLPVNLAKNLHSLCDVYNPVVEKAVIIFTLESHEFKNVKPLKKKAFQTMESLWKGLDDAILPPLLTRLTENVVLQMEPETAALRGICN